MRFLRNIFRLAFPPICFGCRKPILNQETTIYFCNDCLLKITPLAEFVCSHCGARAQETFHICHSPALPVFAGFFYQDEPIQNAIYALKYDGIEYTATAFAALLWKSMVMRPPFQYHNTSMEIILTPIPLSPKKERARGFNQAEVLAEALCKQMQQNGYHASVQKLLQRIKETESQTTCQNHGKRRENIAGAFRTRTKEGSNKNTFVFLVDDVLTSGATLEEAARVLKEAKVPHLAGLVIAKA